MCPADLMIIRQFKDMSRSMIGRPDVPTSVPPPRCSSQPSSGVENSRDGIPSRDGNPTSTAQAV